MWDLQNIFNMVLWNTLTTNFYYHEVIASTNQNFFNGKKKKRRKKISEPLKSMWWAGKKSKKNKLEKITFMSPYSLTHDKQNAIMKHWIIAFRAFSLALFPAQMYFFILCSKQLILYSRKQHVSTFFTFCSICLSYCLELIQLLQKSLHIFLKTYLNLKSFKVLLCVP